MNKTFIHFVVAMFVFALLAGISPKAEAADTGDVIAGIIFGGLLGSEIEKSKEREREVFVLPGGTLSFPKPRQHYGQDCVYKLDRHGYPMYATPSCTNRDLYGYSPRRHYRQNEHWNKNYPCGSQWGYGCRKLIALLKECLNDDTCDTIQRQDYYID